jgi:A/G-specific adenine glycosylase
VQTLGATCEEQPTIQHALTHFDWTLRPMRAVLTRRPANELLGAGQWVTVDEIASFALPAPLKRLLAAR